MDFLTFFIYFLISSFVSNFIYQMLVIAYTKYKLNKLSKRFGMKILSVSDIDEPKRWH